MILSSKDSLEVLSSGLEAIAIAEPNKVRHADLGTATRNLNKNIGERLFSLFSKSLAGLISSGLEEEFTLKNASSH